MKAVVLESVSRLQERDIPIPIPKRGEVRIKILAAGFNPVDIKICKGLLGTGFYRSESGVVIGADCSGVIDAVGDGVSEFNKGDEVFALAFGQGSNGTYAEYTCLPWQFVCKKPSSLSFPEAASLPVVALTAYRAVVKTHAVQKGSSVFFAGGSGGVGSIAIQLAQHIGAKEIFTLAGRKESVDFLTGQLNVKKENILIYPNKTLFQMEEMLLEMNVGNRMFSTFDFVGKDMKRLCLALADLQGHFVSIVPEQAGMDIDVWTRDKSLPFIKNLSLHFVFIGAEAFSGHSNSWKIYHEELAAISEMIDRKAFTPIPPEVLRGITLQNVQKAHVLMEEGKLCGKVVMAVE